MRRLAIGWLLCAALGTAMVSGRQQAPPRDRAAGGAGTAQIAGSVVVNGPTPRPMAHAHVGLLGLDTGLVRIASAGADGRFQLSQLPPGRYLVSSFKPPYIGLVYGATRPGRPGTAIALADGEQRRDLVLELLPGATITGVVTDEAGLPASGLTIAVMPARAASLQTQMMSAAFLAPQVTDDRGIYRFAGLASGEYLVSVIRNERRDPEAHQLTSAEIDDAMRLLRDPSAPPPPARDRPRDTTLGAIDVGGSGFVGTDGFGPLPMLSAIIGRGPGAGYAPVYHPGTADVSEARPVTVATGEERSAIDIVARVVRTSTIEGVLLGPDGLPASNVTVRLKAGGQTDLLSAMRSLTTFGTSVRDGKFQITGVSPGRYALEARSFSDGVNPMAAMAGAAAGFTAPRPQFFASADIVVPPGEALTGLELRLQTGSQLTGRIVFRPTTSPKPDTSPGAMVALVPATMDDPFAMIGSGFAQVDDDGTFTVHGIAPGRYVVVANVLHPSQLLQWMPESMTMNGREFLDLPFDVKTGEDVRDVVVTFTDRQQELAGTLHDAAGRPASGFTILLFAADRAYWLPGSRRVLATRPATDGRFSFAGPLGPRPGDYYLAALTDLDPADQFNPTVLAEIARAAIKVTIAPGQTTRQDIKIAR